MWNENNLHFSDQKYNNYLIKFNWQSMSTILHTLCGTMNAVVRESEKGIEKFCSVLDLTSKYGDEHLFSYKMMLILKRSSS